MSRNYQTVNTTLPPDLKKLAILEDIDFAEALRTGIRVLSSLKELSDEEALEKEIENMNMQRKEMQIKISMMQNQLVEMRKEKAIQEEEEKKIEAIKDKEKIQREIDESKGLKRPKKMCEDCDGVGDWYDKEGNHKRCKTCQGIGRK